ncbi:hypothetical protein TRVL_10082 [Trypanosoma vivax]|nr:hypothetical protein TRVL_10082 [Trypanosoma vivax]
MANVGFRGIQGLRYELGEVSFKPEEKNRTCEGALEYLTATSPEHLLAARSGTFPMPPKPDFSSQSAWGAVAAWEGTVGEMGLTEALDRLGTRAYNRRRPLHAASARPEAQAESFAGGPEDPRKEEGPRHQARPKAQKKQTPAPSNARCLRRGRVGHHSSTCHAKVAREPRWKPKSAQQPRKQ